MYEETFKFYRKIYFKNGKLLCDIINLAVIFFFLFTVGKLVFAVILHLFESRILVPSIFLFVVGIVVLFLGGEISSKILKNHSYWSERRHELQKYVATDEQIDSPDGIKDLLLSKYTEDVVEDRSTVETKKMPGAYWNIALFFMSSAILGTTHDAIIAIFKIDEADVTTYYLLLSIIIFAIVYCIPLFISSTFGRDHIEKQFRSDLRKIMLEMQES